jgi:NAD-dependent deacetylase
MKKIVVLSGAGMSAESGLKTFRESDGLWENHDVTQVATPEAWHADMHFVLEFYNQRRRQLVSVEPNAGHRSLVRLEEMHDVVVITQNIDDLHERAGSTHVIHLHGELCKARSTLDASLIYPWRKDLLPGDTCERGSQLRPHVVWFGEAVPAMEVAMRQIQDADVVIIIGTSMQVYPAAGLIHYAPTHADKYYVDPKPHINLELSRTLGLEIIQEKAGVGVPGLVERLLVT